MVSFAKIAVVEDDAKASGRLEEFLKRYADEAGMTFDVSVYSNAVDFLSGDPVREDVVFLDIDMPMMSGMEAARRLRRIDAEAVIIFVTNMPQFAVEGYAVSALDYMLKPVTYPAFRALMHKAVRILRSRSEEEIIVVGQTNAVRFAAADVYYIEAREKRVIYHTAIGDVEAWTTLKKVIETLPRGGGYSPAAAAESSSIWRM